VEGSPNADYPQLLLKFSLADGSELMPVAFGRGIELAKNALTYRQDGLDRIGKSVPAKDDRMTVEVRYELSPGSIRLTNRYVPSKTLDVRRISFEFGAFSEDARVDGTRIRFVRGEVTELNIDGLQHCVAELLAEAGVYRSPNGAMKTRVSCSSENIVLDKPFTFAWELKYR
jgi:hypothetical protein